MTAARLTGLLPNDVLSRLEHLRINVGRFTNMRRGELLTRGRGRSTDFSDYRDYVPGDDIRFVDWNIFARLRRPYLKLFHQEEERHLVILIDASSSMLFEDKLQRAKQIAAAIGMVGLLGAERVSAYALGGTGERGARLRPCRGRASLQSLFSFLESLKGGGDAGIDTCIDTLIKVHTGRGVVLVLSDFLTFGPLAAPLNRLFGAGLEIWGLQLLGPTELDPDVTGDVRLTDSETAASLDISGAGDLLDLYHEYRERHERELAALCRQRGGRFVGIGTHEPLSQVLFDRLRRMGWMIVR